MSAIPRVSVLMSVYNSEAYLRETMDSVLSQTFANFEFLIMNDASTDKSLEIIQSYDDSRIRLIHREKNIGLQKNLFEGMNVAKGEYIARMDSDDICLPHRFSEQVKFMDSHPDVGMCGSWYKTFGAGESFINKPPANPDDIKANMLFYTSIAHPSVMMRKAFFQKFNLNYNQELRYGEDYELWSRCIQYFPIANIPKSLLLYRIRPDSAFHAHKEETRDVAYLVRAGMLEKIGIEQSEEEKRLHNFLKPAEWEITSEYLNKQEAWLVKILEANRKNPVYKTKSLNKVIYQRWRTVCTVNAKSGFFVWNRFHTSPLFKIGGKKKYFDAVKMVLKYLLKK